MSVFELFFLEEVKAWSQTANEDEDHFFEANIVEVS